MEAVTTMQRRFKHQVIYFGHGSAWLQVNKLGFVLFNTDTWHNPQALDLFNSGGMRILKYSQMILLR